MYEYFKRNIPTFYQITARLSDRRKRSETNELEISKDIARRKSRRKYQEENNEERQAIPTTLYQNST